MFITFEGIDKSGKTTQAHYLIELLKKENYEVEYLREPGGTKISENIRNILLDNQNNEMHFKTEFLLYSASRSQLVNEIILPALKQNKIVICDRFYDSSTAYQGYGRGIDLKIIMDINNFAAGIKPDITLFIDVQLNESRRRLEKSENGKDRLESSSDDFFNKVRNGFYSIAKDDPERFFILDGTLSKENLSEKIWQIVSKKLKG